MTKFKQMIGRTKRARPDCPRITNPYAEVWRCTTVPVQHADSPVLVDFTRTDRSKDPIVRFDYSFFGERNTTEREEYLKWAQDQLSTQWFLLGGV